MNGIQLESSFLLFYNGLFNSHASSISLNDMERITERFIKASLLHTSRDTVIIASWYDDLPRAIQKEVERQGYDDLNPDDRITDVNYKFKIYVIHANI